MKIIALFHILATFKRIKTNMLKQLTLLLLIIFKGMLVQSQTPCTADLPQSQNIEICSYDTSPVFTITRGTKSNVNNFYEYRVFQPNDPAISTTETPIVTISSSSSQFDPTSFVANSFVGITNFWIAEYDLTDGCYGPAKEVTFTRKATNAPTVISSTPICQATFRTISLSVTGVLPNASIYWYDSTSNTIAESSTANNKYIGYPYIVSNVDTLHGGTYKYFASMVVNGCQSAKVPVSFRINPKPAKPVLTSNTSCYGLAFNPMTATGLVNAAFKWYASSNLSPALSQGSVYTPTNIATSLTSTIPYYVTQISLGENCASDPAIVYYQLYAKPATPLFAQPNQTMCQTSTNVPQYIVTNASGKIDWIDNGTNATGTSYTPKKPTTGFNTSFTAKQTENGCESALGTATLVLIKTPDAPMTSGDQSICVYSKPNAFVAKASGTYYIKWYTGQQPIGGSNYTTGLSFLPTIYGKPQNDGYADVSTPFVVTQTTTDINHCEGPASTVNLIVKSKPVIPEFTDPLILVCANTLNSIPLSITPGYNVNFEWHNSNTGQPITITDGIVSGINSEYFLPNQALFKPTTTIKFTVKAKGIFSGCYSDSATGFYRVSKDINMIPIVITDALPICFTPNVSKLFEVLAKGSTFSWTLNGKPQGSDSLKFLFTPDAVGIDTMKLSQIFEFKDPNVANTITCPGPGVTILQEVKSVPTINVMGDSILTGDRTAIPYLIVTTDSLDELTWSTAKNRNGHIQQANNNKNSILFLDFVGNPGFDTLRVSEYNGACYGYDSLIIFKSGKLSVKNVELPISISLSPNPASQYIHIKANSEEHCKGTIKIFNIIGTLVYEKELLSVNTIDEIIPITLFSIGIYTVVIESPIGIKSELLSIQR